MGNILKRRLLVAAPRSSSVQEDLLLVAVLVCGGIYDGQST